MELMVDGVLALLAAVGLTSLVWLAAGAIFHAKPHIPGLALVLPLKDEAPALEADVRELRRIQAQLPGAKLILLDCGLTEEARRLAQYFADREERAVLLDGESLERMFSS